jgi:hypothetical protein
MNRFCLNLFLSFCLLVGPASASVSSGLKTSLDELNYFLTVEWDQKDLKSYEIKTRQFNEEIQDLVKQGLTTRDLENYAKNEIRDSKLAETISKQLSLVSVSQMEPAELTSFLTLMMKQSSLTGANWNGGGSVALFVGFIAFWTVLAIVLYPQTGCKTSTNCNSNPGSCIDECGWDLINDTYTCRKPVGCF